MEQDYLAREVKTQLRLQHPNILRLLYYFEERADDLFHIQCEALDTAASLPQVSSTPALAAPEESMWKDVYNGGPRRVQGWDDQ
eukprot:15483337-Alexandrium_andersonii.AAC.1